MRLLICIWTRGKRCKTIHCLGGTILQSRYFGHWLCILVIIYYLSAVDPNDEHLCTKIDRSILGWVRKRMSPWLLGWNAGKIETITYSFSDTQLVNALSLLASAFINRCEISTYDWQMLVSCVWFASLTQLATIPLLNRQFRKVQLLTYARVSLMTVVLILLIFALFPTAHADWMKYPDDLGVCYLDFGTSNLPAHRYYSSWQYSKARIANALSLAWSIGLLGFTYARRTLSLLCRPFGATAWPTRIRLWFRRQDLALNERFECRISDSQPRKHTMGLLWLCVSMSIMSALRALFRLSESFFGHVVLLEVTTFWGIDVLARHYGYTIINKEESAWSLGQTVPFFLLLTPSLRVMDVLAEPNGSAYELFEIVNDDLRSPDSKSHIVIFILQAHTVLLYLCVTFTGLGSVLVSWGFMDAWLGALCRISILGVLFLWSLISYDLVGRLALLFGALRQPDREKISSHKRGVGAKILMWFTAIVSLGVFVGVFLFLWDAEPDY
ncbi:hypothetical protein MCOR25_010458 [Pyricularia grisea]|nr:hypothetical protein MCOR25_010458 [Pyricularia grisea]